MSTSSIRCVRRLRSHADIAELLAQFPRDDSVRPPEFVEAPGDPHRYPPSHVQSLTSGSAFRKNVDVMSWEIRERLALLRRFIDATASAVPYPYTHLWVIEWPLTRARLQAKLQALLPTFRLLKLSLSKLNALPLLSDAAPSKENLSFTGTRPS